MDTRPIVEVNAEPETGIAWSAQWQEPSTRAWYAVQADVAELQKQEVGIPYEFAYDIVSVASCHVGPDLGATSRARYYLQLADASPKIWRWIVGRHAQLFPETSRIAAMMSAIAQLQEEEGAKAASKKGRPEPGNPSAEKAQPAGRGSSASAPASATDTSTRSRSKRR